MIKEPWDVKVPKKYWPSSCSTEPATKVHFEAETKPKHLYQHTRQRQGKQEGTESSGYRESAKEKSKFRLSVFPLNIYHSYLNKWKLMKFVPHLFPVLQTTVDCAGLT